MQYEVNVIIYVDAPTPEIGIESVKNSLDLMTEFGTIIGYELEQSATDDDCDHYGNLDMDVSTAVANETINLQPTFNLWTDAKHCCIELGEKHGYAVIVYTNDHTITDPMYRIIFADNLDKCLDLIGNRKILFEAIQT